jgi:hypothetical protein
MVNLTELVLVNYTLEITNMAVPKNTELLMEAIKGAKREKTKEDLKRLLRGEPAQYGTPMGESSDDVADAAMLALLSDTARAGNRGNGYWGTGSGHSLPMAPQHFGIKEDV